MPRQRSFFRFSILLNSMRASLTTLQCLPIIWIQSWLQYNAESIMRHTCSAGNLLLAHRRLYQPCFLRHASTRCNKWDLVARRALGHLSAMMLMLLDAHAHRSIHSNTCESLSSHESRPAFDIAQTCHQKKQRACNALCFHGQQNPCSVLFTIPLREVQASLQHCAFGGLGHSI